MADNYDMLSDIKAIPRDELDAMISRYYPIIVDRLEGSDEEKARANSVDVPPLIPGCPESVEHQYTGARWWQIVVDGEGEVGRAVHGAIDDFIEQNTRETVGIDPNNSRIYGGFSDEATDRIIDYLSNHLQGGGYSRTPEGFYVEGELEGHHLSLIVRRDIGTLEISIQGSEPSAVFDHFEEVSEASAFRKRD